MLFAKKDKDNFRDGMIKTLSRDIEDLISQISVLKRDLNKMDKRVETLEKKK